MLSKSIVETVVRSWQEWIRARWWKDIQARVEAGMHTSVLMTTGGMDVTEAYLLGAGITEGYSDARNAMWEAEDRCSSQVSRI